MLGDQRGILIEGIGVVFFDRGGQLPMQRGAFGLELGFIGDDADQRVVKRIFGARGEPDSIDEFRGEQGLHPGLAIEQRQLVGVEPQPDHRGGLQGPLNRRVEPVDAGGDGGLHRCRHHEIGVIDRAGIVSGRAGQHTAFGQVAHHLLGKERVARGPLGQPFAQGRRRRV